MDITFSCPNCNQSLTVDEAGTGLSVPCPKCGTSLTIPSASTPAETASRTLPADIVFKCSNCGQKLEVGEWSAGSNVFCPNCGQHCNIPASTTPAKTVSETSAVVSPPASKKCPWCNVELPNKALICPQCGYDLQGTCLVLPEWMKPKEERRK
ncbi:MAG: zinc-ribbon domain-containing protein [Verrucomicrobiia bacterium]